MVEDICVEVYAALCRSYLTEQGAEEVVSRGVDVHGIVFERHRPVLRGEKFHQRLATIRHLEVSLHGKFQHRSFGEQVETVLAYEFLLSRVLPEEEIEHNAHHWHEGKHHYPCHGLHGQSVVHEHIDDCRNDDNDVDTYKNPIQILHKH